MTILDNIRQYYSRKKYNLPKKILGKWFAIVVHSKDAKLPPAFDGNGKYIDYEVDDIIPIKKLDSGLYAFYKIVNISYRRGDWLYYTDGFHYDLEFEYISVFSGPAFSEA